MGWKDIKPVNPKGNNPKYLLERLTLKLKLQNFSHLMQRTDSLVKTLMLGKIAGQRRKGQQRIRWLDSITDSVDMNWSDSKGQGSLGVLQFMRSQTVEHNLATEQQQQIHVFNMVTGQKIIMYHRIPFYFPHLGSKPTNQIL